MKSVSKKKIKKDLVKIKNDLLDLQKLFRDNTTPEDLTESHNKLLDILKQLYYNPELKQATKELQEIYETIKALEAAKKKTETTHEEIRKKKKCLNEISDSLTNKNVGHPRKI